MTYNLLRTVHSYVKRQYSHLFILSQTTASKEETFILNFPVMLKLCLHNYWTIL